MKKFIAVACLAGLLAGCAPTSSLMKEMSSNPTEQIQTIPSDKTYIVFFRPWAFGGGGLKPVITEVSDKDEFRYVGAIPNGTCLLHETTPGKYRYFWISGSIFGSLNSRTLKAEVEGGKIYYVKVSMQTAFEVPSDLKDEKFIQELKKCKWLENQESSYEWFKTKQKEIEDRFDIAVIGTPTDMEGLNLKPDYGAKAPVELKEEK